MTLLAALDAFYLEHRRCGELETGMAETDPVSVWMTCSCGAVLVRVVAFR